MKKKNVVYIHTHDSGRYLKPYGHAIPTPNIMTLAMEGTLFRHAYCTAPTCSPSRVGMLSGMTPHTSDMLGLVHRGFKMDDYSKHLASYLKDNGYTTALSGVQHEGPSPRGLGYQHILGEGKAPGGAVERDRYHAQCAAQFIKEVQDDQPFYLAFGMMSTHRIYPDYQGHVNPDYVIPAFPVSDTKENREDMAAYMYSAQIADECVGTVLQALKESGKEEDTIVLFTTDHGIAMPFMKCNLYDTGIGVAMILKYSNNPSKGRATDALVSHVDVFPTLCELLELEKPEWLQGVSLVPVLEDPSIEVREEIFAEVNYHAAYEPMRCIRTKRYKLIKFYDHHEHVIPVNIDASAPKDLLLQSNWLKYSRAKEMLFDLHIDPVERVNLINHPQYTEVYEQLTKQLDEWMRQTNDPLLKTPIRIPKPQGAKIHHRSCIETYENNYEV